MMTSSKKKTHQWHCFKYKPPWKFISIRSVHTPQKNIYGSIISWAKDRQFTRRSISLQMLSIMCVVNSFMQYVQTDTASVLMEAIGYIKFLQDQVEVLNCEPPKLISTPGWYSIWLSMLYSVTLFCIPVWQQFWLLLQTLSGPYLRSSGNKKPKTKQRVQCISKPTHFLFCMKLVLYVWFVVFETGISKCEWWAAGGNKTWPPQQRTLPGASLVHVIHDQWKWSLGSTQFYWKLIQCMLETQHNSVLKTNRRLQWNSPGKNTSPVFFFFSLYRDISVCSSIQY
jgi:hypothetical protein